MAKAETSLRRIMLPAYILTAASLSTAYRLVQLIARDFMLGALVAALLSTFLAYILFSGREAQKYAAIAFTVLLLLGGLHLLPQF